MWKTSRLSDKSQILTYLETDRLYAGYAVADLEPGMFKQCAWAGAEAGGRLRAMTMLFRGLSPPALLMIGENDGLRTILGGELHPKRAYLTCRPEHLSMSREFYSWDETLSMWRMVLRPERFPGADSNCRRLVPRQAAQLTELYTLGGGIAFSPEQIERGVFYGVLEHDRLIAVAGTHVISPAYGIAAVGNVFTHPDHRGQGFGTATTSSVVSELLALGMRDIILNVSQDNGGAIRIYERLGFERHCPFLEGPASARESTEQ